MNGVCWVVPSVSRSVLEIIVLYSSFRPLEIRPNVAAGSGVKRTQVKSFVHSLSPPTNAWSIWIDAVAAVRLFKVARWRAARMAPRPQRIHKRGAALDAVAARHRGRVEFAGIGVGNRLLLSVNALAGAHLGNDGRLVDPMTSTL